MSENTNPNEVIEIDVRTYTKLPTDKKKVAIVGFAKSWPETPFNNPDFEIWGLNELYNYFSQHKGARADRWFEIHNPESPSKKHPKHHEWIAKCGIPVYMWQHFEQFPTSMPYPREEVKAMINENFVYPGNSDAEYAKIGAKYSNFSNQITWMVLLAIYEGFEEIHIYGVDMATREEIKTADGNMTVTGEYIWQRPSVEAVTMFAAGRGIKVLVPQSSELCKFPLDYGFETDNQTRCFLRSRKQELTKNLQRQMMEEQKLMHALEQVKQKQLQIRGAIGELSWLLGNHIV